MGRGGEDAVIDSEDPPGDDGRDAGAKDREFIKYTFYKLRPEWRLLPADVKELQKREFVDLFRTFREEVLLKVYSLVGIRADADFLIWTIGPRLETFQDMARRIASTSFGKYLDAPYAYLAASRRSIYLGGHEHAGQEGATTKRTPLGSKYLFLYPFTKKREWYGIPFEKRQEMMREHFRLGHKFPSVKIHTGYSFGLDDQEFVLAFETDEPFDFSDLVMALRSSEASRYTELETPVFTCLLSSPEGILEALGA